MPLNTRSKKILLSAFLCLSSDFLSLANADSKGRIEFSAEHYHRDLGSNVMQATGKAWVRKGAQELWADSIDIDFETARARATGNVRILDNGIELRCSHSDFNLDGADSTFEDATILSQHMVIIGRHIKKISSTDYEIEDGSYSNCLNETTDSSSNTCPMDWQFQGSRLHVSMGGYAHIYDVIFKTRGIPLLYSPYLLIPVKKTRQSGLLIPSMRNTATLGTGVIVPIYWAMTDWNDILFKLSDYSQTGWHLGVNYRYQYSHTSYGRVTATVLQRSYGPVTNPIPENPTAPKVLGLIGEGSINAHNILDINGRDQSRQLLQLVSNPFYSFDYGDDLDPRYQLGYLRSQASVTLPRDRFLTAAQLQYFQPLTVSDDSGVDGGAVVQLPSLFFSRMNEDFFSNQLSYELDFKFSNFYRSSAFDQVPSVLNTTGTNTDTDSSFDSNDYVRTGRRLHIEPRLAWSVPVPRGFQFQPMLKAGTFLYHFDVSSPSMFTREFAELEVPVALQLTKNFKTSIEGYEQLQHIFQPRVVYASNLYPTALPNHPYFSNSTPGANPPGFDSTDRLPDFEYVRFELINRFRRGGMSNRQRFFLLNVSEQLNIRTDPLDVRLREKIGPLELLSSLSLGPFSFQAQAFYPMELTTTLKGAPLAEPVRQTAVSFAASYEAQQNIVTRLNYSHYINADPSHTTHFVSFYVLKYLPTFFDIEGSIEYNFRTNNLRGYSVGFRFQRKPKSCWNLAISVGQNAFRQPFTNIAVGIDLGSPRT